MSEFARSDHEVPAGSPAREPARVWSRGSPVVLCALVAATGTFWLGYLCGGAEPLGGSWAVQVVVTLGTVVGVIAAAINHRRRWGTPARRLAELLPRVQRGEAAIDELGAIDEGGLTAIVAPVQAMARELRQQRAANSELEIEIRQRVANRTDALERTIGTLRQQATRDSLTGLFNRRFMDQYLPQCVQRHVKEHRDLCLLMLDLDNFKVLNDTLGHAAGDDLLRAVGQLIRSTARGEDVAFRCGGDEFVVLLPGYGAEAGRALAERLTSLVDALGRTLKVWPKPRLAFGLATLAGCADPTPAGMLAEADRLLYTLKRSRKATTPEGLQAVPAGVQSSAPSRKAGDPFHSQGITCASEV